MNGTAVPTGQDWPAAAAPQDSRPDAMAVYATALPFAVWVVEITQTMLGMQRELMDLSRGVLRQQQDVVIATLLQGVGSGSDSSSSGSAAERAPSEDGFVGLARLSLEAFDRMAAVLTVSNDPGRATTQTPAADRATGAR